MNVRPGKVVHPAYKVVWLLIAAVLWQRAIHRLFLGWDEALKARKTRKA